MWMSSRRRYSPDIFLLLSILAPLSSCAFVGTICSKFQWEMTPGSFHGVSSGKLTELQAVTDQIQYLNWNRHDRYLVLRLETQQQDDRMHSSIATLGHIEAQIPEGLAFTYQQGIVVIVNLSFKHSVSSDVISSLAIILREGLFKMGVSSEFRDFLLIPQAIFRLFPPCAWAKKVRAWPGAIILMLIFWNICFPRSAIRSVPSFWSLHGWMHCRIMTEKTILSCITHSRSIWSMNAILFRQPGSFLYTEAP